MWSVVQLLESCDLRHVRLSTQALFLKPSHVCILVFCLKNNNVVYDTFHTTSKTTTASELCLAADTESKIEDRLSSHIKNRLHVYAPSV